MTSLCWSTDPFSPCAPAPQHKYSSQVTGTEWRRPPYTPPRRGSDGVLRQDAFLYDFKRCKINLDTSNPIGIPGSRQEFAGDGSISFRRRVPRRLRRAFYRGFPAKTGSENRPIAPTGGDPCLRAAPPTNRPISGRRRNLRFPETLSGKSGNRDFGISSGIHRGGPIRFRRRVFRRLRRAF